MIPRTGNLHRLAFGPRRLAPLTGWRGTIQRYAGATAAVLIAACARLALRPVMHDELPFLPSFVAVIVASALGGFGPGIFATFAGAAMEYFIDAPTVREHSLAALRSFVIEGVLISVLGAWLLATRRRAEAADIATANLEKQMLEMGDKERRRFGHDLHDGLGQQLTGISLLSESMSHRLRAQNSPCAEQAEQITSLVSETVGWTRELARGLSPLTLESDGLVAAIEEFSRSAKKLFGIECRFDCDSGELPIDDSSAVHIYRIIQEAVSNSVKHGKAKLVQIRVAVEKDGVSITVADDGSGLSAKTVAQPGIGLRIMQYRATLIGAKLQVSRRTAAGGTIVSCILPVATAGASITRDTKKENA